MWSKRSSKHSDRLPRATNPQSTWIYIQVDFSYYAYYTRSNVTQSPTYDLVEFRQRYCSNGLSGQRCHFLQPQDCPLGRFFSFEQPPRTLKGNTMHKDLMTINTHRLRLAVDACIDHGYALSYGVLWPETAGILAGMASAMDMQSCRDMTVHQRFMHVNFADECWPEEFDWLVNKTEGIVRSRARARARHGLMQWHVNDIAVQQYDPSDQDGGIDWHRDFARDKHLVAVYTVQGQALMCVEDRQGVKREFLLQPRTLMLLLGPDPLTSNDPRLRHWVGKALDTDPRISIALRMNLMEPDDSLDYA